jgi:predicted ATP-binding protein involved in virulence
MQSKVRYNHLTTFLQADTMQRPDETWHRLNNWTYGRIAAEQLAAQILLDQGFTDFEPSQAITAHDDGKEASCVKDGQPWSITLYFPTSQVSFNNLKRKFEVDLAGVSKLNGTGIIFVTNQELTLTERTTLKDLCSPINLALFHLERIATILDQPHMQAIRQQFLFIPNTAVPITESTSSTAPSAPPTKLRKRLSSLANIIRLDRLTLDNFRCFGHLETSLEPDLTIFVAENGQGKSSILTACQIALWPYVSSFDLANSEQKSRHGIDVDDVRLHAMPNGDLARSLPSQIGGSGQVGEWDQIDWIQARTSENRADETIDDGDTTLLRSWARLLQHEIRDANQTVLTLPVFAFYGTGRLAAQQQLQPDVAHRIDADNSFYIRTFAYRDCLSPAFSYDHFVTWFTWIFESHRETQIKNSERGLPPDTPSTWQDTIHVVQQAIDCVLKETTGWHSLEYSISHEKSLILRNDEQIVMKVAQLSDGVRGMLALVGDLAYRCIKLNPHLGHEAAQLATGVVLIDEIDMHLHPKWQQHVIKQLRAAFPKIQFIMTTHSPQVLSTVRRENIRVISIAADGSASATPPLLMTYGEPSGDVMLGVMDVDPQPPVTEKKDLEHLTELVDQGSYDSDEAVHLMNQLTALLDEQHPQLQRLKRSIRRQRALSV